MQRSHSSEPPVDHTQTTPDGIGPDTPLSENDSNKADDLRDLAILRKRLNLDLSDEQQSALPPDFESVTLTPYRIAELMPYPRPAFLDAAWRTFGHDITKIEGELYRLLEAQASDMRSELISDINRYYINIDKQFPLVRKFSVRWRYEYSFYKRAIINSFDFSIEDKFFSGFEYIIEPHSETYNLFALNLLELMDCIIIAYNTITSQIETNISSIISELSQRSDSFQEFTASIDFSKQNSEIIESMISNWKSLVEENSNYIRLSVRRD